jgi:UDP-3-O-[3-hydroxymyristoyl] glucosamine N-acyltransferase
LPRVTVFRLPRTPIAQIVHIPQSTQIAQIVQIAQGAQVVRIVQIAQSAQIVQIAQIVRLAQCVLFLCHCDCQPKNPQGARSRVEPILTVSKFEYDNGICHPIVHD